MSTRRALIAVSILAIAVALLAAPGSALALDGTAAAVACSPSVPTGTATRCTVTVTDSAASPVSAPTGDIVFGSSPNTATFADPGSCALTGTGAATSCHLNFTPNVGGDYTVTVSYAGDTDHSGSSASTSTTAVDPTTTTITCAPATVQIGTSTSCTAILADPLATQPPIGQVTIASSPTTGSFGTPAPQCTWAPDASPPGGSATCHVTYTPSAAGAYALTASYSGDSSHSASDSKPFAVTATTTPSNGGPGSHGGGGSSTTVTIGGSSGPPPPGTVSVGPRAKVKRKHAQVILTCSGVAGSSCRGALVLTTKTKVKVKVKVKVKTHAKRTGKAKGKSKGTGKRGPKTRTKTKTKTVKKTILVGTLAFTLATGSTQTVSVKLSKAAAKLFAKAKHGKLKSQALVDGAVVRTVTLGGKHKKHHKKGHGHKHKK